jgi:predicted Zn-dependent protease
MAFAFDWIKASEMKGNSASEMIRKTKLKCSTKLTAARKDEVLQTRYFLSSSLHISGDDSLGLAVFRNSPEYKKFSKKRSSERNSEGMKKQFYRDSFMQKNLSWWKQEAGKLQMAGPENWKEQRLLGYLSLLAWSYSTQALQQANPDGAQKFIEIYGLVDPENPEPWYLEAVFNARKGKRIAAERALRKSFRLGFSDRKRLLNQVEFRGMGFEPLFSR